MTLTWRRSRAAMSVLALSLALVGVVPGIPVAAQDSPEAAINELLDAIAAKEFDRVGDLVCAAERESVVSQFDLAAAFAEVPGLDGDAFLEAFQFGVPERTVTLVSEEGDEASVDVAATLTMQMDAEIARPFIVDILEASGVEPTDEMVEQALATFSQGAEDGQSIEGTVRVVREDGAWLLCDDMSELGEGSDVDASLPPAEGNLCGLASVDELSALGPLSYGTADASVASYCTYTSDDASGFHSLTLLLDTGLTDVETLRSIFPDAEESSVAGQPAFFTGSELYVATQAGALMLSAYLPEEGTDVDLLSHLVAVGELVVPRLSELPVE